MSCFLMTEIQIFILDTKNHVFFSLLCQKMRLKYKLHYEYKKYLIFKCIHILNCLRSLNISNALIKLLTFLNHNLCLN